MVKNITTKCLNLEDKYNLILEECADLVQGSSDLNLSPPSYVPLTPQYMICGVPDLSRLAETAMDTITLCLLLLPVQ
jgi:hypothetical protein